MTLTQFTLAQQGAVIRADVHLGHDGRPKGKAIFRAIFPQRISRLKLRNMSRISSSIEWGNADSEIC